MPRSSLAVMVRGCEGWLTTWLTWLPPARGHRDQVPCASPPTPHTVTKGTRGTRGDARHVSLTAARSGLERQDGSRSLYVVKNRGARPESRHGVTRLGGREGDGGGDAVFYGVGGTGRVTGGWQGRPRGRGDVPPPGSPL